MIALDGVSKSYRTPAGRKIVLDNATVTFAPGHNFGILGANGAGKSTLIRLLAGTEQPDRGVVRRQARVSFPLGFGGTFHGALSRYSGADGTKIKIGACVNDGPFLARDPSRPPPHSRFWSSSTLGRNQAEGYTEG